MSKSRKGKGKRHSGYRLQDPYLWKPGDPLTKKDHDLLSVLIRTYEQLGYVPAQKEVPNASAIKNRFRTWKDAIAAAGLPPQNGAKQQHIRQKKREWEKRVNQM